MGVVSGITMSFQFGTNWPGYMEKVGNIAGPLLAYEVLTAFFLEATFLGVMLFGMSRVSARVHIARDAHGRGRHHALGVLDPRAQLLDADARGPRDGRRRAHRRRLAGGDLQSVVPLPLRRTCCSPRASPRRSSSPGSRPGGCSQATARTPACEDAAHRRARRRGARPAADLRRRPARPEHARAPAGEDRGDGGDLEDRARRVPLVLFAIPNETRAAQRLRDRDPEAREPHPQARSGRGAQGPRRVRARHAAGGAGVLRLPPDGGHGRADAALAWFGAWCAARGARRRAGCCGPSPASPSPAGSRRSPAGSSPRSAASPGSSPASCARRTPAGAVGEARLGASLDRLRRSSTP